MHTALSGGQRLGLDRFIAQIILFCYLSTSGFGQIHEVAKTEMNNLLLLVLSVVEYYVVI